MWAAPRAEFPTKLDFKSLKGDPLGKTENPAAYIHRLKKGCVLSPTTSSSTFFTAAVLHDVVGLSSKSAEEFCKHVSYAVDKYREKKQKLKEQERELLRKVVAGKTIWEKD